MSTAEDPHALEETLSRWHQAFLAWARDVGAPVPPPLAEALPQEPGPPRHAQVLFGEARGMPLWQRWSDIPGAAARDALLQMVSTQADCYMGAVELNGTLLSHAPSPEDAAALRTLMEQDLHAGAALGALLIRHFPKRGLVAAQNLLERRAVARTRVLHAFNQPLQHWVDLLCFVAFVNLCAKMALATLAVGSFAPVAGTAERLVMSHGQHARLGLWGLSRVVESGSVETALLQRYVNRWVALALDLFGWDHSQTAALAYQAGIKGRVHERERSDVPDDPSRLNDDARRRWLFEVENILGQLNQVFGHPAPLRVPPLLANRSIVQASAADVAELATAWPLPTSTDDDRVRAITAQPGWIKPA